MKKTVVVVAHLAFDSKQDIDRALDFLRDDLYAADMPAEPTGGGVCVTEVVVVLDCDAGSLAADIPDETWRKLNESMLHGETT